MKQLPNFFNKYKWAILSGILIGTSYLPFPPWALWCGYLPLWWSLLSIKNNNASSNKQIAKDIFRKSWVTQFVLSLIGFYWIFIVSKEYGYLPTPVALLLVLLFASFMHIYIAIAHYLGFRWLGHRPHLAILATLCWIVLAERFWPTIFPWNLGYPLMIFKTIPIFQAADVIGFLGLSFCVYLSSWLLAMAAAKTIHLQKSLLAFVLLWLGLSMLGLASNKEAKTLDSTATHSFKALIVQANVGNLEKAYAEKGRGFMQEIVTKYFQLTAQALTENKDIKPDLVIWPESAFPEYLNAGDWNRKYSSQLRTFLQQSQITLLTGAYSHVLDTSSNNQGLFPKFKDYNALFLLAPPPQLPTSTSATDATLQNPKQLGLYHKTLLLVFGEYIPLLEYFPWMAKYNPAGEGFSRGKGPQVLDLPTSAVATDSSWKLGVQICYESLYPEFSESLVKQGAQILINLTNDSWFSQNHGFEFMRTSSEAYQHMYMTLARAIETRRPLFRSTNTGITTAITAGGEILTPGPTQTEWFHFFEVPVSQTPPVTFYTRWGAWLMIIPILILVLLYGAQAVRTRSRKSSLK